MLSRVGTPHLLVATAFLGALGPFVVYSASAVHSELTFGSSTVYLWRQLQGVALGIIAAIVLSQVPLLWLRRTGILIWSATVVILALTLTPFGAEQHGARRWVELGGVMIQPLELVKLGVVLGLAQWLSAIGPRVRDLPVGTVLPLVVGVGLPAGILVFQPDFGGALLLGLFAMALLFSAGARPSHLLALGLLSLPVVVGIATGADYRLERLEAFIDPFADPRGSGYQLIQSLLAFGAGGLFGTGFGAGQQKLGFLPEAHTDFVLSIVGEELGLLGVSTILIALAAFGLASVAIAGRARDRYGLLLASGAGLLVWLQGLINAAVTMGLLPTTGTTLPFLSYGRSSLVTSLAAVGLILNVARPAKRGRSGWR